MGTIQERRIPVNNTKAPSTSTPTSKKAAAVDLGRNNAWSGYLQALRAVMSLGIKPLR